jgi:4-oxalocrotonate tautomerase
LGRAGCIEEGGTASGRVTHSREAGASLGSYPGLVEERMPVVIVEMWAGRTTEQKQTIVKGITEVFARVGTPPEAVHIIISDVPKTNWATGGKLASEEPTR